MFAMGRRADVLHGGFVHPDPEAETGEAAAPPFPPRPVFPKRPPPRVAGEAKRVNSNALESLLAAIKQDLKDVA